MTDSNSPRILLIDDEPSIREPLSEYLTAQGLTVTAAETASGVAPWRNSATSGSRTRRRSQSETRPIQATLRVKNTLPRSVSSPDCLRQRSA